MSQPIRGQGGHLVFPIGPKNTNLVKDVEILLPVKFRWIPFSGFRGEVENVLVNQRPVAILFYRSARKTQTWWRTLGSCFLSSFVEFCSAVSEEKLKMWKVIDGRRTDGRTDDGQCVITIVHLSPRLRCTKKQYVPSFFHSKYAVKWNVISCPDSIKHFLLSAFIAKVNSSIYIYTFMLPK